MRKLHVWQEQRRLSPNTLRRTLVLEPTEGERARPRRSIHFDISADTAPPDVETMNHAAAALIQVAMSRRADLVVHGPVCATLLDNLEQFQAVWSAWLPQAYPRVGIAAEREVDGLPATTAPTAVAAFSAGVDSAFTVWRHHFRRIGRRHLDLRAAVFVQGFDIDLRDEDALRTADRGARAMLADTGIEVITIRTNLRSLMPDWENTFPSAIAGCLHQVRGAARIGLIASDDPYSALVFPWGSNPVTNLLLSSGDLAFHYDSGGYGRCEKVEALATWPAAVRHLRVCWQLSSRGRNCGRCEKCWRTILNFRLAGVRRPECFDYDPSDDDIRSIRLTTRPQFLLMQDVLDTARAKGIRDGWVAAVAQVVAAHAGAFPCA